jgi:hypothetical protein
VLVVCTAVLAACGGDDDDSSDAGSTTPSTATPTLPSTTTTTSPPSPYKATVTPTSGLTDGQDITVTVSDFTAGLTLGINECAEKEGDPEVGAEDCALDHLATLKVGPDGTGTGTSKVYSTDVGSAKHDCTSPDTRCFISVGELKEGEAERADDVDITFGG